MSVGIEGRVESLDWPRIASDLDAYGCAVARGVLDPEQECHVASKSVASLNSRWPMRAFVAGGNYVIAREFRVVGS